MRRIAAIAVCAVALVGCGDVLEGVGDLSSDFVRGDQTTTSEAVADSGPDLGIAGITIGLLGMIGVVAGWFPARAASKLDPVVAMKM